MKPSPRKSLLSLTVLLFWLGVWVLASALVGQELLLPSPLQVLRRFLALAGTAAFWLTVGTSILRVLTGIVSAVVLGTLLAFLTESSALCKALFSPVMVLVKSTPVASFIILALIWLGRGILPAFISALMVLPVVWANVSAGIAGRDPLLLEMARIYGFSRGRVLRRITLPTVLPFFRSALSSALGPRLEGRDRRGGPHGPPALYREDDLRIQALSGDHGSLCLDADGHSAQSGHRENTPEAGPPVRQEGRCRPCLN